MCLEQCNNSDGLNLAITYIFRDKLLFLIKIKTLPILSFLLFYH